ncbi:MULTISPECIES: SHOCT domain-containing protein [Nocardia]|uniref:SHOCT domain-containing protein n=3 Tax=Nocardia TaxID=1817 RepID=A0A846XG40_9NOCA|nr:MULTISPECIES: SHOCT domain-containing protein [Nocardia]MBF6456106.1 SHOCT domain-containing protein [Nocardia cyriacigeorgica]MBF6477256.1 SHOCT domain-containing protein [Nocardia cyriacigeorgica]MBF6553154.1 SHOCT domain-containing protein [Nocardia cyriacigeorgica]NKY34932.1 SHOCT domain-containing protein [Nocardia speluncae]TLF77737.1 SHOCT domain-containing protein [Nocardia cyriacigeorgica]
MMTGWVSQTGWAGWTVMAVCMLVFWAAVIYLMAALFRTDRAGDSARPTDSDPLRMLESRFARGDIDADEFVARRQLLAQTFETADGDVRKGHVRE